MSSGHAALHETRVSTVSQMPQFGTEHDPGHTYSHHFSSRRKPSIGSVARQLVAMNPASVVLGCNAAVLAGVGPLTWPPSTRATNLV